MVRVTLALNFRKWGYTEALIDVFLILAFSMWHADRKTPGYGKARAYKAKYLALSFE